MGQKPCCCTEDNTSNKELPDSNMALASLAAASLAEDVVQSAGDVMLESNSLEDAPFTPVAAKVAELVEEKEKAIASSPNSTPGQQVKKLNPNEFTILLEKTESQRALGMRADASSEVCLVIHQIMDGLLKQWNEGHPDLAVKPGDRLMSVNGWVGDADDMTEICHKEDTLEMVFVRGRPDFVPSPAK